MLAYEAVQTAICSKGEEIYTKSRERSILEDWATGYYSTVLISERIGGKNQRATHWFHSWMIEIQYAIWSAKFYWRPNSAHGLAVPG